MGLLLQYQGIHKACVESKESVDVCCKFTDLLGQIVVHDECVSPVVPEELAHGTAGVRREVLQRRRVRRCRAHDDRVLHGVRVGQSLDDLRDGRSLLTDSDVDAVQLRFLVLAFVESLLIDDGVNGDRRLAAHAGSSLTRQ